MPKAYVVADNLGGWPGKARLYKLDPPARIAGGEHEHVVIYQQPRFAHQNGELGVVPATEHGAAKTNSVRRQGGSFTLHDDYDPSNSDYVEGAYWMALQMLGGYA